MYVHKHIILHPLLVLSQCALRPAHAWHCVGYWPRGHKQKHLSPMCLTVWTRQTRDRGGISAVHTHWACFNTIFSFVFFSKTKSK